MTDAEQNSTARSGWTSRWSRSNTDGLEDGLIDSDDPIDDNGQGGRQGESDDAIQPNQDTNVNYTSQFAALFIIVNVTIGVGLLAMPAAVQSAGIVTSIIIQTIFLLLIIITCIICTELTVQTNVSSYHQIIGVHCHRFVDIFTQVSIFLLVFGTAVAYIVTIGDQADRIMASLYGPTFCNTWYMNRRFIMVALTVFIIKPLCSAKTVDFLKYGSFLGTLALGFIIYVVISEFLYIPKIPDSVNYFPKKLGDLDAVLPVFCFAYQCHLSWVPVVASMKKTEKRQSYVTISVGMLIATIIYVVVSAFAVLTFGSAILSDLTENYPGRKWSTLTTIGIVAVKCLVTLPPAFLPARLSVVDALRNNVQAYANLSEPAQRISATYVTLTAALMLAIFVPDILVAVNILGCLAVAFIFTLPALSYLNLVKVNRLKKQQVDGRGDVPIYTSKDKIKRAVSYFLIVFGNLMTGLVLYKSVLNMIANQTPAKPLCVILD